MGRPVRSPRGWAVRTLSLSIAEIRRQLERLFRRYVDRSPKRYYLELRLTRARQLIQQTNRSVTEIAVATGFVSPSHFSRAYRARFAQQMGAV